LAANTQVTRTDDGGETWVKQNLLSNTIVSSMHFADSMNGFITTGSDTIAYKTTDGGVVWTPISNYLPWFKKSVYFTSADTGYVASESFEVNVSKTTDGGITWDTVVMADDWAYDFTKIAFSPQDKNIGYLTGEAGRLLKTTDGGLTWNHLTTGFYNYLFDMEFTGDSTLYVCSNQGFINKSTDLGATWSTLNAGGTQYYLYNLHFLTDSIGFVVGDGGVIKKTTNAGTSWINKTSNTVSFLYDIQFADQQLGFVCGANGVIRKTIDGGETWTVSNSTTGHLLTKIFFTGTDTCYIAADSGYVLRTTNAGATWTKHNVGHTFRMTALWFFNSMYGLAGDASQRIYRTYDAGLTWEELDWGWGDDVIDLIFDDAFSGYYLQSYYSYFILQHTSDGGQNWTNAGYFLGDEMQHLVKHNGQLYSCGFLGRLVKLTPAVAEPVAQPYYACAPGSYVLNTTATGNIYWYDNLFAINPLDSGNTFTTPFLTQTDTFYVAAYDTAAGCFSYKKAFPVYINSAPVASLMLTDTVCHLDTPVALAAGSPAGGTYTGTGVTNNTFDPVIANAGYNWITYTYTDNNGCADSDSSYIYVEICTGINDITQQNNVQVYPLITTDAVTIDFGKAVSEKRFISIIDLKGQLLFSDAIYEGEKQLKINVADFSGGGYIIQIVSSKEIITKKLVKM
jgi:photosystem II stability/assembly factor-like uncharacterized protein